MRSRDVAKGLFAAEWWPKIENCVLNRARGFFFLMPTIELVT